MGWWPDKKVGVLWCLALVCGVGAGYGLRSSAGGGDEGRVGESIASQGGDDGTWSEVEWKAPVRESLEDIVGNETSTRLARMTLWLLDAQCEEIAQLWRALEERTDVDGKDRELVMMHWTEADPLGALSEVRGTSLEYAAWWAWGRADPEKALETALREAVGHADTVLRGIGQFHPELAVQLMEKYPEALAWKSVTGIGEGLAREDPGRAAEFLRSRGQAGGDQLEKWAAEDPEAALAWVQGNVSWQSGKEIGEVARKLVIEHPERVEGWLAKLPTGALRLSMAREYVAHLFDQDVGKAMEFAQSATGLRSRLELMTVVGDRLMMGNTQESIELLGRMRVLVREETGAAGIEGDFTGLQNLDVWTNRLLAVDPVRVIEELEVVSEEGEMSMVSRAMNSWMGMDEAGYAEWLLEREPGAVLDYGAKALSERLIRAESTFGGEGADFESAAEWASAIGEEGPRGAQVSRVMSAWLARDPEGAAAYVEGLPEGAPERLEYERRVQR